MLIERFYCTEIQEAILSLKDSKKRTITIATASRPSEADDLQTLQTDFITSPIGLIDKKRPDAILKHKSNISVWHIRRVILEYLHLKQIVNRYESVKEAYKQTFE